MNIDPSIFKAYDIRGVYGTSLTDEIAYKIACAYSILIKEEVSEKKINIAVGNDMRLSSPNLKKAIINGLTDSGIDVTDIGLISTPSYYFAVAYYGFHGGIQVSASHNPKEYNGFKLTRARAVPISGDTGIYKIRDLVIENKILKADIKGSITQKKGILEDMIKEERIGTDFESIGNFKIVADAANAVGALDIDAIFKNLNCELIRMNWELDGNFPSHQPDPLKEENLVYAKEKVLETGADLAIVPDGDGDRYFFLDEKGDVVRQDVLRGIIAQLVLKKHPGANVCYDVRPGRITKEMILDAGGVPLINKVGHSLIKEFMLANDSEFSGESSGHYFFKMPFGSFEAPVKLIYMFLSFVTRQKKPLSEIVAPYLKYFQSGEINSEVQNKDEKIKEIAKKYSDAKSIDFLDGISVEYDDYWFNVRPSNTENLLRLNLEAVSEKIMEEKRDEILDLIKN